MSHTPPTPRAFRRAVFVVLTSAVLLAACGGSDTVAEDAVASIGDVTPASEESTNDRDESTVDELEAPENPEDAFELFNQCMADAGVDGLAITVSEASGGAIEIPADDGGATGEVDPQQSQGSLEDFDIEEFEAANEACEGHLANIDQGFDVSPEEQARLEDTQLEWASCMQEQGVDVPDFDVTGSSVGITIHGDAIESDPQTGQASLDDLDFEAFREAAKACSHIFEDLNGS
ncbi:MAG: hypothetical protein GY925_07060 [Actinomycetia bacterium]|nr:hypothetical protein [Actinomycetes bacterium]